MSSGIRRKVDDLGRVVIPAGIRRSLNIREGDAVEVSVDGERIVLTKPRDACVFCGREGDDLHRFRSRLLCRECVASVGKIDGDLRTPGDTNEPRPVADAPWTGAPTGQRTDRTAGSTAGAPARSTQGADVQRDQRSASTTAW